MVERKLQGRRGKDAWADEAAEDEVVRIHRQPRRELFTPLRVSGAPTVTALATLRVTTGRFAISGRAFRIVDSWTARAGAHRDLGEAWTGSTTFTRKSAVLAPASAGPTSWSRRAGPMASGGIPCGTSEGTFRNSFVHRDLLTTGGVVPTSSGLPCSLLREGARQVSADTRPSSLGANFRI